MLKIKCTHIQQQSICQVFKARNVCFSFSVLYSPSYVWSLTVVYPNNLQWGGLATLSYLLPIANDQSWKDYRWKHWELTPWWSAWNGSILQNSNKYVVTCLRENNIFYHSMISLQAKQNNSTYFAKLAITCCFNCLSVLSDPAHMK